MSAKDERFQLEIVLSSLKLSLENHDDIKLNEYLAGYEEFNKFFNSMGTVFGLVSSDLKAKIDILYEFLKTEQSHNFVTAKTMIEYEKSNNLLKKKDYLSGSRTLLRLHRGLEFIHLFLKRISELQETDNTADVCKQSYDETLAKYHPFLIRKGAKLAMYYMPNRDDLLKKVCGETDEEIWKTLEMLPETLDMTKLVYERIEVLYTAHDLHSLP